MILFCESFCEGWRFGHSFVALRIEGTQKERRIQMAKNTKVEKRETERTELKELPKSEKKLSKDELRHVKGGGGMMSLMNTSLKPPVPPGT